MKKICLGLLTLFVVISMMISAPRTVKGDEALKDYFVIEKVWEDDRDLPANRPAAITVHVLDKDDNVLGDYVLKAEENWKKTVILPHDVNDFYVYEDEPTDYVGDYNSVDNSLKIEKISVEQYILDHDLAERSDVAVNTTDGFNKTPKGNIIVEETLDLNDAIISLPDKFSRENKKVYNTLVSTTTGSAETTRITYTGSLPFDGGSDTEIVLTWDSKAYNYLTGERYKVQITLNNIVIEPARATSVDKKVAIMSYQYDRLNMNAYYTTDNGYQTEDVDNIVGVSADISITVLDENNQPFDGYTQVYFSDIDFPDYKTCYAAGGNLDDYYGPDFPYSEKVVIEGGLVSDVYLNNDGTLIDNDGSSFAGVYQTTNTTYDVKTSLKYLADTNGYTFKWTGSFCGSSIVYRSDDTNDYPAVSNFTNSLTNYSSLYKVRYFYENEDGEYEEVPNFESEITMRKPGNKAVVRNDAELEPELEGFELDEDTTKLDEELTLTHDHTTGNPLLLNVYFKRKVYVVTYHDNVKDTVFDKQPNPDLKYGTDTPAYDGDPNVRPGYEFVGWTTTPDGKEIMTSEEVEAIVVKENADYWAHWVPRKDTKYRVEFYYKVDGEYPKNPDDKSVRKGTTDSLVEVKYDDLLPKKSGYELNEGINAKWKGVVLADGTLVLKVYFDPIPPKKTHTPPETGVGN